MCGPGASASSSGALGFLASISRTAEESSMGFGPSSQLCLLDNGRIGDDAGLGACSISLSSWGPLLCGLLRLCLRSFLGLSEMIDGINGRKGRQASENIENPDISRPFSTIRTRRENWHSSTMDNGNFDLDTRPDVDFDVIYRGIKRNSIFD